MIDLEQLTFGYTKRKRLFDGLDLKIRPGAMCGLLGKNGAGKTSLLRIIAGLLFPDGGSSRVLGVESEARRPEILGEVYLVPEEFALPEVTVKDFVATRAPFYPRFDREVLAEALGELEVPDRAGLHTMSYGQRKKFLIAFGMAAGSRVVLLDEPTNGLDIPSKSQLRKLLIGSLSEERAFVVSTHQVRDLASILDPIVILDRGRILLDVDVETLGRRLTSRIRSDEAAEGEVLWHERVPGGYQVLEENTGGTSGEIDIELLFNAVTQQPDRVLPLLAATAHEGGIR
ncbi:MAG: ATP-binding cassette domain-containing protein [Spirochaetota bacterium]